MNFDAISYMADGTSDLVLHRGEPLTAVKDLARLKVEGGFATRVEIFDSEKQLIAQFPRVTRDA